MVFKTALIFMVIFILMEDSASIRKTAEEEKEDEEVARAVNATLAEEEKRKKEEEDEKKKRDEKSKMTDKVKDQDGKKEDTEKQVGQGEDCPSCNFTCPEVETCHPCRECPKIAECDPCPKVKPCKPCPIANCSSMDIPTVQPCPVNNSTSQPPPEVNCQEPVSMSPAVAMAIGACASLLATGVAAVIGLLLRYASPIISGLLFISIVLTTWYLSSRYPEIARDLGERVVTTLREATVTLGHRVMEAIRHHQEQVSVPIMSYLFFRMSSMFQKVCTKIFYVIEN
jgi:hypothetical protein